MREIDHRLCFRRRRRHRHAVKDAPLFLARGISDFQLHHETVNLRLRQRIGAFLVDRIFRCEDEDRPRQGKGGVPDGHLALLHRFEEGALHFRRSTVDFVGKHDVCEDRTRLGRELARLRIVNQRADNIRRQ